jgi:hypothetical protein
MWKFFHTNIPSGNVKTPIALRYTVSLAGAMGTPDPGHWAGVCRLKRPPCFVGGQWSGVARYMRPRSMPFQYIAGRP